MILKRIHFKRKTNFFRFKFKNENELFALWLNKEAVFRFVLKQTVIMHIRYLLFVLKHLRMLEQGFEFESKMFH